MYLLIIKKLSALRRALRNATIIKLTRDIVTIELRH